MTRVMARGELLTAGLSAVDDAPRQGYRGLTTQRSLSVPLMYVR
jgi:hypothetical protein